MTTLVPTLPIPPALSHRFCVAPMMDWTDRHCRYFLRLLSRRTLLYTEMVTIGAILYGDWQRHLRFDAAELPLALQLGGSNPTELAQCAKLAEAQGYSEINLNVGCPSDRVQNNMIGACLMAHPNVVAECVSAMQAAVKIPVTVKCRVGIDAMDSDAALAAFIETVAQAGGCRTFILHARIALLQGLSPKENRDIPPLNYPRVYWLKQQFPHLEIIINGGIHSGADCHQHLSHVDGVMLGRAAYHNPWVLNEVDSLFFGEAQTLQTRHTIIEAYLPYLAQQLAEGVPLQHMTRHILGIFHEQAGGKRFRRHLSENAHRSGADLTTVLSALQMVGSGNRTSTSLAL